MVENAVVMKEQLTSDMVDAGAALLARLDAMGVPITAAFWFLDVEINDWVLYLASPHVETLGRLKVYSLVRQAADELADNAAAAPFSSIQLIEPSADLVRRLRATLSGIAGKSQIRLRRNIANGRYIEDALIYRMT